MKQEERTHNPGSQQTIFFTSMCALPFNERVTYKTHILAFVSHKPSVLNNFYMNSLPHKKLVNLLEREEIFPVLEEDMHFLIIFEGTALSPLKKMLSTDFPKSFLENKC